MWLGTLLKVRSREVSAFGRLKRQCLFVAWTITKVPLKREVSAYGRLKRQCLYVAGGTISVLLWEMSTNRGSTVLIVLYINSAESNTVTMYGRGFEKFNSAESHSVRCGFKFNDTYRQGMLYWKIMMSMKVWYNSTP